MKIFQKIPHSSTFPKGTSVITTLGDFVDAEDISDEFLRLVIRGPVLAGFGDKVKDAITKFGVDKLVLIPQESRLIFIQEILAIF